MLNKNPNPAEEDAQISWSKFFFLKYRMLKIAETKNARTATQATGTCQKTILEVAEETETLGFKESLEGEQQNIEFLKTTGTVTLFTPQQSAAWQEFAKPTYDAWLQDCQKAGYGDKAEEVMKILDRYR